MTGDYEIKQKQLNYLYRLLSYTSNLHYVQCRRKKHHRKLSVLINNDIE